MKRTLIAVVLALSLLLIPSAVSAAGVEVVGKTGDGEWVDNTWKVDLYSGESKFTTLTLRNSSSSSLEVWVTIIPGSLDNGNVTFELSADNFTMPAGNDTDVILTVRASGSATPDSYTAKLGIRSEVPPTPTPSGGNGAEPIYSGKADFFGSDKTFYTDYKGKVWKTVEATSEDGNLTVTIPKGTTALGEDGKRLKTLEIAINEDPPAPPEDTNIIGLPYDFGPTGATFEPPITFTWSYDPDALPEGVFEENLVLAYYIDGQWVELECVVDTETNTITTLVSHFTTFAIIGSVTLPPPPVIEPEPVEVPPPPVVMAPPVPEPAPPVVLPPPEIVTPAPEPAPPESVPLPVPEEPEELPTWAIVLIAVGAAIIAGLVFWLIKKSERARQ